MLRVLAISLAFVLPIVSAIGHRHMTPTTSLSRPAVLISMHRNLR